MGVWEDALREAAAQRREEVQALQRQRAQAAEQARVLGEFLDGMRRLGVKPRPHPFLVLKGLPELGRYRRSHRHKIIGWEVCPNVVVTPEGEVYDLKDQDREPCDLRRPLTFPQPDGFSRSLTELLRQELARAEGGTR
ncbi:hypothetical protein CQY20_06920 [Mycolicibacterium agri]|uniref:Uncharacterized protein n=1 Tax=Mycolicibacterium agri TaxID=36811 RepID=A0A2A7N9X4_MYCAG|nr:hypothetical protein [Mycolicibacterium agri]PEG40656.1 hypothetical protein CQY20_06920 [Mycolicibacterium agri]GFG50405.1 hypothetical protein MAGR_18460 [Mycolicibacterium agri]